MKELEIKPGIFVKVSDEDYDFVKQFSWSLNGNGYATAWCHYRRTRLETKPRSMHELIVRRKESLVAGKQIDHINQDKLDNQRDNLRQVTSSQNKLNRTQVTGKSGRTGIYWDANGCKWMVKVKRHGYNKHLGCFEDIEEATRVRQEYLNNLHQRV